MVKKIEVGNLYRSSVDSVVFVVRYDKKNNEYVYYFLDTPEVLLARHKEDAHHWWDHV